MFFSRKLLTWQAEKDSLLLCLLLLRQGYAECPGGACHCFKCTEGQELSDGLCYSCPEGSEPRCSFNNMGCECYERPVNSTLSQQTVVKFATCPGITDRLVVQHRFERRQPITISCYSNTVPASEIQVPVLPRDPITATRIDCPNGGGSELHMCGCDYNHGPEGTVFTRRLASLLPVYKTVTLLIDIKMCCAGDPGVPGRRVQLLQVWPGSGVSWRIRLFRTLPHGHDAILP